MKNILIIVLVLAAVGAMVFANIMANEADLQKLAALENLVFALENGERVRAEEQKAVEAASMARMYQRQVDELTYELKICK